MTQKEYTEHEMVETKNGLFSVRMDLMELTAILIIHLHVPEPMEGLGWVAPEQQGGSGA